MRCAVFGCNSDNQTKREFDKSLKFFRFPVKDADVCEKWIKACSRADRINANNGRICELHFNKETDYERCLKEELLGYVNKNRRQLKKGAVPSIMIYKNGMQLNDDQLVSSKKAKKVCTLTKSNPGRSSVNVEETNNFENVHQSSLTTNKIRVNIQDPAKKQLIIKNIYLLGKQVTGEGSEGDNNKSKSINNTESLNKGSILAKRNIGIKNNDVNLKNNIDLLGKQADAIHKRLIISKRSIGTNTEDSSDNQKIISDLKQKNTILEWQTKGLKSIFSPAQIKKINEPLKRPRWSEEDISNSVILYATGPRLYKLLLKKGYPLPAIATLRFWMKKSNIKSLFLKTREGTRTRKNVKIISNKQNK